MSADPRRTAGLAGKRAPRLPLSGGGATVGLDLDLKLRRSQTGR